MHRYVALLRGINVGGHRVKMDHLRGLFEALDLADVSTFIASGNVVFSTASDDVDGLRTTIERHLEQELGYEVATFLRTPAQLATIGDWTPVEPVDSKPFASHYVIFLREPPTAALTSALADLASEIDAFHFEGREVHWLVAGKVSESPLFAGELNRVMRGACSTMRNMNTVRRLVAKAGPPRKA